MEETARIIERAMKAKADGQYEEAKDILKEALKDIETKEDRRTTINKIELHFVLAEICRNEGRWFDSLIFLERVTTLAESIRDLISKATALVQAGEIFSKSGKWDKAMAKFKEAEGIVKNFENPYLQGKTMVGFGMVHWRNGRNLEAVRYGKLGYEIGVKINNDELTGQASSLISNGYFDMGDYDKCIEASNKAIEAYKRGKHLVELGRVLNNHGEIYKAQKDYEKAIDFFKEGLKVVKKAGNKRLLAYLNTNMAECYIRLEKEKDASKNLAKAEELALSLEDKYLVAYFSMVKGMFEDHKERYDTAKDAFEKGEKLLEEMNILYDLGIMRLEYARCLKNAGRAEDAEAKAKEAIDAFTKAGSKGLLIEAEDFLNSI